MMPRSPHRRRLIALALLLGSLGLRLGYHLQTRDHIVMEVFSLDDLWYHSRAQELLDGKWPGPTSFERGPLYPYFLAGVYALTDGSSAAVRLIQHFLGALQVLLLYRIGLRLVRPRWAVAAAALAAVHGAFIMLEGEILIESGAVFLVTAALDLLVRPGLPSTRRRALGAGLWLGAAAVARPNLLLVPPLAALWLLSSARRSAGADRRLRWTGTALLVGSLLVIGPVTIRNTLLEGRITPISSHGGINFYLGNNPTADGHSALALAKVRYGEHYEDNVLVAGQVLAEQAVGHSLKPSEVSSFWYRQGWAYALSQPRDWLLLEARKLALSWNAVEITNYRDMQFFAREYSPLLRWTLISTALLLPLAGLGMAVGWRRRWELGALYALVGATWIVLLAFFVTCRFRITAAPALILFAGVGLDSLERAIQDRRWSRLAGSVLLVLGLALIGRADLDDIRQVDPAPSWNAIGKLYIQRGDLATAESFLSRALEADPDLIDPYGSAWVNLARLQYHLGRKEQALASYQAAILRRPNDPEALGEAEILIRELEPPPAVESPGPTESSEEVTHEP